MRELPKYKCHKTVHALKIAAIEEVVASVLPTDGSAVLHPADDGYAPFKVDADYMQKHKPEAGGYYVVYEDGYKSYSPAAAFEGGYTRI